MKKIRFWGTLPFTIALLFFWGIITLPFLLLGKIGWWGIGENICFFSFDIVDKIRGE